MQGLVVLSCLIAVGLAESVSNSDDEAFNLFKIKYGNEYSDESEEAYRRKIFLENKEMIEKHNERYRQGEVSSQMVVNRFADLTKSEFSDIYLGCSKSIKTLDMKDLQISTFIPPANLLHSEEEVDWRKKGAVTAVKDQGQCGSCWAFGATGSLEGQTFRKTGKLVSLSEQNLIDCDKRNNGCKNGDASVAYEYIKENHGIDTEESYPYEAKDGACRFNKTSVGATVTGYSIIKPGDEEDLMKAVATVGPISVAIDASHPSFQFYYSKDVYYEPECKADLESLDHEVLVVGYGVQDNKKYWLVKNSWGTDWGDDGYILMERGKGNHCGIASEAIYPLV